MNKRVKKGNDYNKDQLENYIPSKKFASKREKGVEKRSCMRSSKRRNKQKEIVRKNNCLIRKKKENNSSNKQTKIKERNAERSKGRSEAKKRKKRKNSSVEIVGNQKISSCSKAVKNSTV